MSYIYTVLKEEFIIKHIYTVHYFEYTKDFVFCGEKHDFWEFVYVDKGEINITAEDRVFRISQGDIVFHKPNEFHNVAANGVIASNIVIVSFECKSKAVSFFNNKIMTITKNEKNILSQIIKETTKAFKSPLGNPFTTQLVRADSKSFASEHMIKILLEQFLISLYRNNCVKRKNLNSLSVIKERIETDITEEIIEFLKENLTAKLKFSDIASFARLSHTALKSTFKEKTGMGVMQYYNYLKIEAAKTFIRENNYNITQIANLLGYDGIHYFSKVFKRHTGVSPTQYCRSVIIYTGQ